MSEYQVRTIPDILKRSLELYAGHPALSFVDDDPLTFRDVDELSRRLGLGLRSLGVKPGDHVAILSENIPNWGVAYLAIARIGAVVVPILPDFNSTEVGNILRHAEVQTVLVSSRQFPKLAELQQSGELQAVLLESLELVPRDAVVQADGSLTPQGTSVLGAAEDSADVDTDPETTAAIIYTSGTTGNSKGVMLSHTNIVSNVEASRKIPDIEAGQSMLSLLPLSHTYECTLGFLVPLASGACVYYLGKPPSPSILMPALQKIRPHLMLAVPLFIEKIFRVRVLPQLTGKFALRMLYGIRPIQKLLHKAAGRKVYDLFGGRLHFFGIGGAGLAPDVERFLRDAGFPYAIGYGLTETSPLVAGSGPKETTFHAIGPVVEGVQVRLDNQFGGRNEGEVQVLGPNVMQGYYKDPERTAEVFTEDGWFRTGDIGHLSSAGVLSLRGRIKNMLLGPSGENIYPEEIEAVINEKPYVEESLVTQKGDQLVAMVYLNYEALLEHVAAMHANIKDWHSVVQGNVKDGADQIKQGIASFKSDIDGYLDELRRKINSELNMFSKLADIVPREEPFEKTPTMKIKRYLYT
ncbi:AMP-binding protein [Spirochaeta africana]|uniref:AMP-forming long-chain acyl-CoA synthetase n=1 Tax=Spirochaeta africana (strain ATCC 700263 / DSM 8902 / Z-7692) TaxID=889378 RepID=H9UJY2_SPIAZ|nr:AMP-binding protein [Spirochaeta africana]AFG37825.1 AMP-forming long-chain acyl-CoA synthetase [Spirochaeta africana DSM 8902]